MPDLSTMQNNALARVRAAREGVSKLRLDNSLTDRQREMVDAAYDALVDCESELVKEDLKQSLKRLQSSSQSLAKTVVSMKRSVEKLKKLAKVINTAAKAVGTLADIISELLAPG